MGNGTKEVKSSMQRKDLQMKNDVQLVSAPRPALSSKQWAERYPRQDSTSPDPTALCRDAAQLACQSFSWTSYFCSFLPILTWLPRYSWKTDLVNDIVAGFTVAVMHIPQGMAYALLAGVAPVVGIYTGFFPILLYALLGTMPHNSMGTFAVISILVSKPVIRLGHIDDDDNDGTVGTMDYNGTNYNGTVGTMDYNGTVVTMDYNGTAGTMDYNGTAVDSMDGLYSPIEVTTAVALCVGIIQFAMGLVRLGSITVILTDVLISGFTVGASIHVFTSQIKHILGVKIPSYIGVGRIVNTYVSIFTNIASTNLVSLLISVVSVAFLLIITLFVAPKVKQKCRFPIPSQIVLIIIGTVLSIPLNLSTDHQVKIISNISSIPTGLPIPTLPRPELIPKVFFDAIPVAIIAYVIGQSLGTMFGSKHGYTVDPTQELIAQGAANMFGSIFSSLPMATSLSRSLVQEESGGKSFLTSIASSLFLLVVLLWIGPVFEPLPVCILASIILASLKGVLMKMLDLKLYWSRSPWDGAVWLITFLATVLLDVDLGLVVGIVTSMMVVMIRGCLPRLTVLQLDPKGEVWLDRNLYKTSNIGVKVLQVSGPVHFLTAGFLKFEIQRVMKKIEESNNESRNGVLNMAYVTDGKEVTITNDNVVQNKKMNDTIDDTFIMENDKNPDKLMEMLGEIPDIQKMNKTISDAEKEKEQTNTASQDDIKEIMIRRLNNNENMENGNNNKVAEVTEDKKTPVKDENDLRTGYIQSMSRRGQDMVLDLSQVTFMDTMGAKMVKEIFDVVNDAGGRLVVAGIAPHIQTVLDNSKVKLTEQIFPTYMDALELV